MKNRLGFLLLSGLAALSAAVHAQTLPVAQDSYVVPSTATNYGVAGTVNVGGPSGDVGLVQFDLTALANVSIGSIAKATLVLFVNKLSVAGTMNIAEATNVAWSESAVTGLNAPSAGTPIASGVPVATGSSYISVDVTQAVKDWLAGTVANNGFVITAASGTSVFFDSKESATTSHPAALTIILNGVPGATGATGPPGPTGATGATGATGRGVSGYGYVFNRAAEVVAIEAPVAFDSNGPLAGLTHAPGNAGIVVTSAGVYSVTFSVSGVEPSQFASGMIDLRFVTPYVILGGLIGAISWDLITWWFGLPTSSSHAFIGGYAGAAMARVAHLRGLNQSFDALIVGPWSRR